MDFRDPTLRIVLPKIGCKLKTKQFRRNIDLLKPRVTRIVEELYNEIPYGKTVEFRISLTGELCNVNLELKRKNDVIYGVIASFASENYNLVTDEMIRTEIARNGFASGNFYLF